MRRLAAIMFTDMVGYSALTQENEALALRLLEEHRTILRPLFTKHAGREIETAGDLFFVEFDSAVEATLCAIEIQEALDERNKSLPGDEKIILRIGLHIGDVVYVDKHVHGDGVNIAARIQPLAPPGGIYLSEDVARQIRNKVDYPVVSVGRQKLKNISTSMEIYEVQLPWQKGQHRRPKSRGVVSIGVVATTVIILLIGTAGVYYFMRGEPEDFDSQKLRLAVLPLENISADAGDQYFADGMTEELISNLSKITNLRVIARSSVMKYKSGQRSIPDIGDELNVGTILEGTVRKAGNKARINVKLIDVANQETIWSMDYDRNIQDIFLIQSEIAENVAAKLQIILVSSERSQLGKNYTENTEAFQEYLIGKDYLNTRTSQSIHSAVEHFERSIVLDPDFPLAYASLSYAYALISGAGYGSLPGDMATKKAKEAVAKALKLDPTLAEAHAALGYINFRLDWNWDAADREFKRAIELKPGYSTAHEWYALFLAIHRRFDESLEQIEIAYDLDPISPSVSTGVGRIYHFRGDMEKAIAQYKMTIARDPGYGDAYFGLGMAYFKIRKFAEATAATKKALELAGRRPVMVGILGGIYARSNQTAEALKILEELKAPDTDYDKMYARSVVLVALGREDESVELRTKLYDVKYGLLIYLNVEQSFFGAETQERLKPLLKKMKFE